MPEEIAQLSSPTAEHPDLDQDLCASVDVTPDREPYIVDPRTAGEKMRAVLRVMNEWTSDEAALRKIHAIVVADKPHDLAAGGPEIPDPNVARTPRTGRWQAESNQP